MIALRTASLDRLREAVRERVEATSLRHVARQVGMSPTGLRNFLAGGIPYQKSRRRLFEWMHREDGAAEAGPTSQGVSGSLASLVADLPPERRGAALQALVGTLRTLYDTHADAAPSWLGELSGEASEPEEGGEAEGGPVDPARDVPEP
jgi:AcrR family transcriptional regulator